MAKSAHLIVTLTFTLACLGLWAVLGTMDKVIGHLVLGASLPGLTTWCLDSRPWLLFLPIPVAGYSLARLRGRSATIEHLVLFSAVLALAFTTAFFTIAIAMLLPWM